MRIVSIATALALAACNTTESASKEATPVASAAAPLVQPTPEAPVGPVATNSAAETQAKLTRVEDVSQVCMVNNQFMGKTQIPVAVEGKTYFGCCEMCKGRLARDPSARTAKDPVSGKDVDKAVAVIAKRESGDVLYFENEQNLERYRSM